jgi:DNA-binding CsgD family transcriptional regulator
MNGLRTILVYGAFLAVGAFGLQWLEYQYLVRAYPFQVYAAIVALAFLSLGVWAGARMFRRAPPESPGVNAPALESLGISAREREVLELLAAGRSNKEIARHLDVSPNTVKTHVGKLFEKLAVRRRTQAISRARELGILT